jgi:parvulin-like peptidyl-prolyl isomerase
MRQQYVTMFKGKPPEEQERELREWARENVIDRVLLRQAAVKRIEPVPRERVQEAYRHMASANGGDKAFVAQLRTLELSQKDVLADLEIRLRTEEYIRAMQASVAAPSDEEVGAFYDNHQDEFVVPELVRAGHIVVHVDRSRTLAEAEQTIEKVAQELRQGGVFESLASLYSDCPDNDGDLGWFPRGEMVEEFENAVFALEPNQLSGIIRSPFGFHIAKLYERKPAQRMPLEQARGQIVERLLAERKNQAVEESLDTLRAIAEIQYH